MSGILWRIELKFFARHQLGFATIHNSSVQSVGDSQVVLQLTADQSRKYCNS